MKFRVNTTILACYKQLEATIKVISDGVDTSASFDRVLRNLRPSSDVVLLPCRTKFRNEVRQKHGRSTASESNF